MKEKNKVPNALSKEKSPYLLQHAYNPVQWLAWGPDAFNTSLREDKPIFLSVGYSTCHWCHVMERESFENDEIAQVLNHSFVPVKIDREERPDIDRLYMAYVQASTGSGGWPMSVWLTPELKPFYGGTYYPPEDRFGRPGFLSLLHSIADAWKEDRKKLEHVADGIQSQLKSFSTAAPHPESLGEKVLDDAFMQISSHFDPVAGGFSSAPKFPRPSILTFLFNYAYFTGREEASAMALLTLERMARGGIHDHLGVKGKGGGGFARYATDALWHVPHFEKMLYDNALLALSFLEAFQLTKETLYAQTAEDIFNYVMCDMTSPEGAFYSAEDADSFPDRESKTKIEGGFYVWTKTEIAELLDPLEEQIFSFRYGVKQNGNVLEDPHGAFDRKNILSLKADEETTAKHFDLPTDQVANLSRSAIEKLFQARMRRPRPDRDDKIITSWNALMISALAKGSRVLQNTDYLTAAEKAAGFIGDNLFENGTGNLLRRYCKGESGITGQAEDYAFLIQGLLDLYEASFDDSLLHKAQELAERQCEHFYDDEHGGFFNASSQEASVPIRLKEDYDGAEPSANSVSVMNFSRLWLMTGKQHYLDIAEKTLYYFSAILAANGMQLPEMLAGYARLLHPSNTVILTGSQSDPAFKALKKSVEQLYLPGTTVMHATKEKPVSSIPGAETASEENNSAAAYICKGGSCRLPVTTPEEVTNLLRPSGRSAGKKS